MSLDVYLNVDKWVSYDNVNFQYQPEQVYSANITHNLNNMAHAARIYDAVWRPDENGYETAGQIIGVLSSGIEDMKANPEKFKALDSPNGWGKYQDFLPWLEKYLEACKQYPNAKIRVWR